MEIERGSTRSHCLENMLWKGPWTFRKTDYVMMKSKVGVRSTTAYGTVEV